MVSGLNGHLGLNALQLVEMASKPGQGLVQIRPPGMVGTTVNLCQRMRNSKPQYDHSVWATLPVLVSTRAIGRSGLYYIRSSGK